MPLLHLFCHFTGILHQCQEFVYIHINHFLQTVLCLFIHNNEIKTFSLTNIINHCRIKGMRMKAPWLRWFEERYDIDEIKNFAKSKLVPSHKYEFWYFTGGIVLFLFITQFITGMVLALYYIPHADFAHKSIIDIVTKINAGWFFRSLHHWGAQLAIAVLFIHLFQHIPSQIIQKTAGISLGLRIHSPRHLHLLRPQRILSPLG